MTAANREAGELLMRSRWPELEPSLPEDRDGPLRNVASRGAPGLLGGLDAADLSHASRLRVQRLQRRVYERCSTLAISTYVESKDQPAHTTGFNSKVVLDVKQEGRPVGSVLHKPMSDVDGAKVELVTIVSNLLGVYTPLSIRHSLRTEDGAYVGHGISTRYLESAQVLPDYDFTKASEDVLQYTLLSRWVNELVGNLHCWWAQFLLPIDPSKTYSAMVMIDLDDAFNTVAPDFLQQALVNFFGKQKVSLEDCGWLSREFSMDRPIAWSPSHYDSCFNIYGSLFRDFVLGHIDIDVESCVQAAKRTEEIPDQVFSNAMTGFLDASNAYYKNPWIFLPAAGNPKYELESFRDQFIARIRRSAGEFFDLLDELGRARKNRNHEMFKFYETMPERPY